MENDLRPIAVTNTISNVVQSLYREYFSNYFHSLIDCMQLVWQYARQIYDICIAAVYARYLMNFGRPNILITLLSVDCEHNI